MHIISTNNTSCIQEANANRQRRNEHKEVLKQHLAAIVTTFHQQYPDINLQQMYQQDIA